MTPICGVDVPESIELALPHDAESRRCGSVHTAVVGAGRPLVLIPGLGCGASVFGSLMVALRDRFELHAVTLAGFGGAPAVAGPWLTRWRADLHEYLRTQVGARPIVIGHSLGGMLALAVAVAVAAAVDGPGVVGGVVVLDGVPAIAGLVGPDVDLRRRAEAQQLAYSSLDAQARVAWWSSALHAMISRSEVAQGLLASVVRSDPSTVAGAMTEIFLEDLRAQMPALRVPVLAIAALGAHPSPALRERHRAAFAAMYAAVPEHEIVVLERARHFVMLDAPTQVHAAIVEFVRRHRA